MSNLVNFFKNRFDLVIILLLGLIPLLWYGNESNRLIFGHDVGYALDPVEFYKIRNFNWTESVNFGFSSLGWLGFNHILGLEALATIITGSVFIGQKIIAYFWFVMPALAIYLLIKRLEIFKQKPFATIIAPVLFSINYFQMQGWGMFWRARFSIYAVLPLFFLLFLDYMEGRRKLLRTVMLASLIMFFFNGGGSPPLYGALILELAVCSIFFLIVNFKKSAKETLFKIIAFHVGISVGTLLLSMYWVLPYVYYISNSFVSTINAIGGSLAVIGWTDDVTRFASVLSLLRLQGLDFISSSSKYDFALNLVSNPYLIILSFIFAILIISSLLLVRNKKEKKYILLFFIIALISLIFTAGSHDPFRSLYILLLKIFPPFSIFRTTVYKFGGLYWFSYTVLLTFVLTTFLEKIQHWESKKRVRIYSFATLFIFLALIFSYNYPFFNKKFFNWNPPLSTLVTIPKYVQDFDKWLDQQIITERILLLPELNDSWKADAYKWGYWSLSPLSTLYTSKKTLTNDSNLIGEESMMVRALYENFKNNDPRWKMIAGVLNVKYFFLRNDFYYDLYWGPSTPPEVYRKIISSNKLENIYHNQQWDLYKYADVEFLPLFYVPNKVNFIQAEELGVNVTLARNKNTDKALLVFSDGQEKLLKKNFDLLVNSHTIEVPCILCKPNDFLILVDKIKMPGARILPDSILYSYIIFKENRLRKIYETDPGQIIDVDLILTSKRLAEISLILQTDNKTDTEKLIEKNLEKYNKYLSEIRQKVEKLEGVRKNEYLIRIYAYLEAQRSFLHGLERKGFAQQSFKATAVNLINLGTMIRSRVWMSDTDEEKRYLIDLSKSGEYELIIGDQGESPYDLFLNDKLITNVKTIYLDKGIHKFTLKYSSLTNLLGNTEYSSKEGRKVSLINGAEKIIGGINNFSDDESYLIKFDYRVVQGLAPNIVLKQDNDTLGEKRKITRTIDDALSNEQGENSFRKVFTPRQNAKKAQLSFSLLNFDDKESVIEVRNMTVSTITKPKLLIYRKLGHEFSRMPNLTFQKINPTKYIIQVKNAPNRYILNFSEKFDPGWKAYLIKNNSLMLSKQNRTINTYFVGKIKELQPLNRYFDFSVFHVLFASPLPEDSHFRANGYSNSWILEEGGDYEIVIEYWPQRLLYLGAISSYIILILILVTLTRRKSKSN